MRNLHSSVETVNAAATAIISAESRVQPSAAQRRSYGNCWSIYWCFGWNKPRKRISHSVLVSSSEPVTGFVASIVDSHNTSILLPSIAPPSSPTSFLPSHDPSSSPLKPLPSVDRTTLFTLGPYAHETQLVSPPVFSAFTTEPSTASFTPPPETTTPPSPEVPFAELLSSSLEFRPYYRYPGSPMNNSSGGSSPPPTVVFRIGGGPQQSDGGVFDHRVSFELLGEEIPVCVIDGHATERNRTMSLGSSKDFHFNNREEEEEEEEEVEKCEWWTKDKSVGKQWSFFSMLHQSSAR